MAVVAARQYRAASLVAFIPMGRIAFNSTAKDKQSDRILPQVLLPVVECNPSLGVT